MFGCSSARKQKFSRVLEGHHHCHTVTLCTTPYIFTLWSYFFPLFFFFYFIIIFFPPEVKAIFLGHSEPQSLKSGVCVFFICMHDS